MRLRPGPAPALSVIFFLSGASALIFETLWLRQAGLAVGNSVWATALVLAAFMGGLALGNGLAARLGQRLRRPILAYAALEVLIGATGATLVWALPRMAAVLAPVFRLVQDRLLVLNTLRAAVAFALLLIPATAMGATLPVLVRALFAQDRRFGLVLGRLYGWNTLGAVAGAVAGEAFLIGRLGIMGTGLAAAGLDLLAAAGAATVSRHLAAERPAAEPELARSAPAGTAEPAVGLTSVARHVLAAAFLTGAILLALEVVWFRFMSMFVGSTTAVQAALLAVVLLGIGLGGLVAARWLRADAQATRHLMPLALVSGVLTIAAYAGFSHSGPEALVRLFRWPQILSGAARLMLPVSFLSGVLFTLLGEAANREIGSATRSAGLLTMVNTVGAMLGPLVAGFLLLPGLGMELSFFVLALGYGLVALVVPRPPLASTAGTWRAVVAAALGLFVLHAALFPFGLMRGRYFAALEQRFGSDGSRLVYLREGLSQTILILRRDFLDLGLPAYYRLCTDSFWMSSTTLLARRYMKLFVYWPVAVHPNPRRALLISYGVGMTAKALTDTSELERIDIVDTSRDILQASPIIFPDPRTLPLADARVRVHVEDGRHFLQTTALRYDIVTAEPPPPQLAGVVTLYTREYFQLVRDRLEQGGIVSYWLPVHSMGVLDMKALLQGFCQVFEDCSLWQGHDLEWMMAGSRGARGPHALERFTRQWRDPRVLEELSAVGLEQPAQLGAQFIAGPEYLREIIGETAPLVDDYPQRLSASLDADWLESQRAQHRALADAEACRRRFERSGLLRRLWPESLREQTLASFAYRKILDRHTVWAPPSIDGLDDLYSVLTQTQLETLPLWMLQTSVDRQRAVVAAFVQGRTQGLARWLGLGAIAGRNYATAAAALEHAELETPGDRAIVHQRVLALCLAGRQAEARVLLRDRLTADDDRPFRNWISAHFPIEGPSRATAD
jgi:spermidine synthase